MPLVPLNRVLAKAREERYAVGAFNVFDPLSMESVVTAAAEMESPVIIQTLPPIVQHWGATALANWAKTLSHRYPDVPVVLHLDHGTDLEVIQECITNGWTSVMIDASRLPLTENISLTKTVIEKAHPLGISVEGEIGSIFSVDDSKDLREAHDYLATVDSCLTYARQTGIDALAPAIGTAHGLYRDAPSIHYDRLRGISEALDIPIVIHGGTGLIEEDFQELIRCGANKINIATQINLEFMGSLRFYIQEHPDSNDPLDLLTHLGDRIRQRVTEFVRIFGSSNRASSA